MRCNAVAMHQGYLPRAHRPGIVVLRRPRVPGPPSGTNNFRAGGRARGRPRGGAVTLARLDLADTIAADRSPRTYDETTSGRDSAHRRSVRWPIAGTAEQTSCAGQDTAGAVPVQTRKRPPTTH